MAGPGWNFFPEPRSLFGSPRVAVKITQVPRKIRMDQALVFLSCMMGYGLGPAFIGYAKPLPQYLHDAMLTQIHFNSVAIAKNGIVATAKGDRDPFFPFAIVLSHFPSAAIANGGYGLFSGDVLTFFQHIILRLGTSASQTRPGQSAPPTVPCSLRLVEVTEKKLAGTAKNSVTSHD